jgi:hypothetical protein
MNICGMSFILYSLSMLSTTLFLLHQCLLASDLLTAHIFRLLNDVENDVGLGCPCFFIFDVSLVFDAGIYSRSILFVLPRAFFFKIFESH